MTSGPVAARGNPPPVYPEQAIRNHIEGTVIVEAVVHGVLHLCGYDHETDSGQMLALQERVLAALT